MAKSSVRFVPIFLYVFLIFFLSSRSNLEPPGPEFWFEDKIAHFSEYLVLGVLLFRGIGWGVSRSRMATFLFLFAVGVSLAALDEIFQSYIPGRSMSVFDWCADAAGVGFGLGVFVFSRFGRRRSLLGGRPAESRGRRGGESA